MISTPPNGYKLNCKLNITTDYELFQIKRTNALNATTTEQKISLLEKAFYLYNGSFFRSAAGEHWIMSTAVDCYHKYVSLAGELLKTLYEEMHYGCVHNYATRALLYAPHTEDLSFWMIRSLMRVGHAEVAHGELRMAQTKLLDEEYSALEDGLKEVGDMP